MRALLQRVSAARVCVSGEEVGRIDAGLLVFVCAMKGDADAQARALASKLSRLRIFSDAAGKMNRSIHDAGGRVLAVSQFTLAADTRRGTRPGFSDAAPPDDGRRLFDLFVSELTALGVAVETGRFGAEMQVSLTNDGPVTIWLEV
ncbi:MAG: D-aminoacyl-tRNA deacylase [Pseudomonadota bacterium]